MQSEPITAFENQVGGHRFDLQKQGMLHQGSTILKQLQDQGRGVKEELFYEKTVEQYPELKQWIAGYHGTKEIHMDGIDGQFMILDDLTFGYDKPSVIDLKIGTETWEEDAPKEKIERESKKYPLQRKFGFRLTGMRVYNKETHQYDIYDKKYGYSITEDTLNGMFALFFSQVDASKRTAVIQSVIDQLRPLLAWFETPGRLRFICSSVLIILEGGSSELTPIVRLVDFAHVKQLAPSERDEGCITGLRRILSELSLLVSLCVCLWLHRLLSSHYTTHRTTIVSLHIHQSHLLPKEPSYPGKEPLGTTLSHDRIHPHK